MAKKKATKKAKQPVAPRAQASAYTEFAARMLDKAGPSRANSAEIDKLVASATKAAGSVDSLATLAVRVSSTLAHFNKPRTTVSDFQRLFSLLLILGKHDVRTDLADKAFIRATSNNWLVVDSGRVALTDEGKHVASGLRPMSKLSRWSEPGLPPALEKLARFLSGQQNREAAAYQIYREIGQQPSSLWAKYPKWAGWLQKHISRPRRGVFRLV